MTTKFLVSIGLVVGLFAGGACGITKPASSTTSLGQDAAVAGTGGADGGTAGFAGAAGAGGNASADASVDTALVRVAWASINKQSAAWYATSEAAVLADNIIYYQNVDGGWPKNIDMTARAAAKDRSTIDNNATTTQMVYLSLVYGATKTSAYADAFNQGVDYLLEAQYPANGGWPQFYPTVTLAYQKHITYNDNAMVKVMTLLRDIGNKATKTQYSFVDDDRATKATAAVQAGIACILKTQIETNGVKSAWCAQHDEVTLAPANARAYELISNSGSEAAGVLQFLMAIDNPSAEVIDAVQSATAWFDKTQIKGIRVTEVADATQASGKDVVVVADPSAPPLWARFYDIATDVPFFCGRDGIKKATLAEIENERRTGYAWYGDWPAVVLKQYASTWQPKWAPGKSVLSVRTTTPDAGATN